MTQKSKGRGQTLSQEVSPGALGDLAQPAGLDHGRLAEEPRLLLVVEPRELDHLRLVVRVDEESPVGDDHQATSPLHLRQQSLAEIEDVLMGGDGDTKFPDQLDDAEAELDMGGRLRHGVLLDSVFGGDWDFNSLFKESKLQPPLYIKEQPIIHELIFLSSIHLLRPRRIPINQSHYYFPLIWIFHIIHWIKTQYPWITGHFINIKIFTLLI